MISNQYDQQLYSYCYLIQPPMLVSAKMFLGAENSKLPSLSGTVNGVVLLTLQFNCYRCV